MDSVSSLVDVSTTMASALPSLSAKINPNANIDKTSEDFEAMFATQMLQPMFEGMGVNPIFGGGHGEEVMRSFLLQEYGKMIAKTGKLGIARQVKSEMLRAQEAARTRDPASLRTAQQAYANAPGAQNASN